MKPGARLRRWAGYLCSRRTMERLIDPVIADLQHEYEEANASGRILHAHLARLRGYVAFWRVLALHVPSVWLEGTIRTLITADSSTLRRALLPAAMTMVFVTAILIAPPVQGMAQRGVVGAWLLALLVPQSLPFSIPLTILTGVVCGLRGRVQTRPLRRVVVIIGLAGTLASVGTIVWVIPASNQAFRVTIAGGPVARGPAEMPPRSLRDQALVLKSEGREEKAGSLLFSYHARWAIPGAALVFALFGLGVATLRLRRAATAAIAIIACAVYVSYFFEMAQVSLSVFSDERISFALAWLPNLLMTVTSIAFLSARDDRRVRADG